MLLSAGGSAEGAARGRLHCSRIGIRIRAIRARSGWAAPSPAEPRGQCPGTRSGAAPRRAVRDQRYHRRTGRRHTAPAALPTPPGLTPRGEQAENGLLPATRRLPARFRSGPRQPPPQARRYKMAAALCLPPPPLPSALQGNRDRGCRLPPALRGEDPHRCLEGGRANGARAKLSRLDPQRDPSSAFPHWTKWRLGTTPPAFI